jgi:hypothetical protein
MPILRILDQCVSAGVSWDVAMSRLSGEYYQGQVDYAVREYRRQNPEKLETNIPGFEKWMKENGPR